MALGHVHLTPQLVQAVRDAVDVVDIASEHTRLKQAGRRWSGLCPLHKEKTPSFSVDPAQGLFYCFGCGAGGDGIKLHMLTSGDDFPAAIESLARRYGIPLPSRSERRGDRRDEPDLEAALDAAAEFFAAQLERSESARAYLARRQVPPELIREFGLGFAPDGWQNLVHALRGRVPAADLEAAGLVARSERRPGEHYDRFRNRLVFPIRGASGRILGFGGRTLGDDPAKYVNTSETESFHKGTILFGLDLAKRAIREGGRALLVEGYFDVLGAIASGVRWTVAGMGTALTPEQARLLARYAAEVVVGYDADAAGEQAYRRALPLLLGEGLEVRRARFGDGEDPDSLRLKAGGEAVQQAVEQAGDAVLGELDRLIPPGVERRPQEQAAAAAAVAELLRPVPDSIVRFGYGRLASERLGVPPELLWKRLQGGGRAEGGAGRLVVGQGPRLVRSLEEQTLERLLSGGEPVPAVGDLPPEEAFLDSACRNIFRAFCTLYGRGRGEAPAARAVLDELAGDDEAVDRMAQLLLEGAAAASGPSLAESLDKLRRRWRQQRLRQLARDIGEAQRAGDRLRLERLLNEKTSLSRSLHRGSDRSPGGEAG